MRLGDHSRSLRGRFARSLRMIVSVLTQPPRAKPANATITNDTAT